MKIEQSAYYKRLTEPLRTITLKDAVTFGEEGFSYKGKTMEFVVLHTSKNIYKIAITSQKVFKVVSRGALEDTVADAVALIKYDLNH